MKKKKMVALLLVATMVASALSGCGGGSKDASESAGNVTESADSGSVKELTFYNADGKEDPWTDPVATALTEATGVKLKTSYPVSSVEEDVALMIAEQKYSDLIFVKGEASSLIEAGALIDMTDLIEEYGPNIKKLYGDEFDKLQYSKDDTSIYQLSSYAVGGEKYKTSGTAQIQWNILKENNYEYPKTLDEFETMIRKYVEAHPTTDDGQKTIGLTLSAADWHWLITLGNPAGYIADGAPDNGQWLVDDSCNATYKFTSDKEKEYFKWLNHMYNEGLLDPEFATQTHEDYIAKIASGRVRALLDTDWDYADGENVLKNDGQYGKTYAALPLTIDENTLCPSLMYQGLVTGYGVGISSDCEDPVAAIKFLDYLCSDEGQVLVQWGIEGENYEVDESGKRYRTEEEIEYSTTDPDYSKKTGVGFHSYPFPCYGDGVMDSTGSTYTKNNKEEVIAAYNEEEKAACEAWNVELLADIFPQADKFAVPAFSPVWAYTTPSEFDEITTQLDEIAWSSLISCVMASEDKFDETYDKMISDLESAGMKDAETMLSDIIKEKAGV